MTRHHSCRVSPFGHPRIHARLAAPRGLSQPPTSFIGSQCQGIHHAPLNTYKHKNQRINLKLHHNRTHTPGHNTPKGPQPETMRSDARNHYPQIKHHTPPPRWSDTKPSHPTQGPEKNGPVASGPNSVFGRPRTHPKGMLPFAEHLLVVHQTPTHYRQKAIQRIV